MNRKFHKLASCAVASALTVTSLTAPDGLFIPAATAEAATASADATTKSPSRVSVHDPSIVVSEEDGTYYIFGSHIEAAKSTDMVNWTRFTNGYTTPGNTLFGNIENALKKPFQWAGSHDKDAAVYNIWAPDVYYNKNYVNDDGTKGAYMMYFCTTSTYIRSAISFAVSQNIEGPYTYKDTIVYSGFTKTSRTDSGSTIDTCYTNTNIQELIDNGTLKDGVNDNWFNSLSGGFNNSYAPNAIDPTILEDKDGKLWMTYGSWSGGIFILEIDPSTGKAIYPGKNADTDDSRIVDEYFGTRIAGGLASSGEGPFIVYDEESDYYYLYSTYEGLNYNAGYNMRLFRSKNPDGPYLDAAGNNAALTKKGHDKIGIRVLGNYRMPCMTSTLMAGGHNSALIDSDGERYLIYHTRFNSSSGLHEVRVHQQFISEEGWPVTAVYENKGDKISETGYDKSEIVGDYFFINHGTDLQTTEYNLPKNIVLTADGKVTGAATGTWEAKENTYYAKFVLDGVSYSGVFFKQHTETASSKNVMTFTAIGDDNTTIWGSKRPVSLSLSRSTIYCGGDTNKTANLTVNGSSNVDYTISYTSSKPKVATVNKKGVITAKKAGTTKITGVYKAGSVTKSFTKTITVKKASLTFKSKKSSMKVGKQKTFKVKGHGLKATSIKWTSSNKKILTVGTKNGKVKALKKGTAKITASYKKFSITCKVKVK